MIRLVRESSPWIIKGLIIAIAIAFIGSMGWVGFEASQPNTVATVGNYEVTKEEYLRTKQRYYRFYRDQLKQEDVKDETLSQLALNGLVTTKSWQALADEFNLVVSAQELHDNIVNQKDFQKDGAFNPQYYQRLLQSNRMTSHKYEEQRKGELLAEKAQLLVSEGTTLAPGELQEVKDLVARQTLEGTEPDPEIFEQIRLQFLMQKKQRALEAFQAALRARGDVVIHEELL